MADSDKNIVITPATGTTSEPRIAFNGGATTAPAITMYTHSDGTLSYESNNGQLFSITDDLSGEIFSVSDISGIPSIRAVTDGRLQLNPHSGNVLIGSYDDNTVDKLQIQGGVSVFGDTGQLFSVVNDPNSETIFTVADISGIPSIRVKDSGDVYLAEFEGNVGVGTNAPSVIKGMQIEGGLRIQHRTTYPNNVAGNDGVLLIAREDTRDWGSIHLGYHDYGIAIETSGGAAYALAIRNVGGYVVRINGAGDILANSHGSISDQRLKENITPLTNSLQTVMSLRGVNFTWIQKPEDGVQVGLIAQEVEAHVPSVVQSPTEEDRVMPDGSTEKLYKHVEYGKLVPLLIEAIKEQQQTIDELKARLDSAGL